MSKTNKTLRRQQAAAAAGEQAPNLETVEEVNGDALDPSTEEQVPGSGVDDQAAGSVEGDRSDEVLSEGSDAPEVIAEQPEAVVMRGGTAPVATLEEMPFLPPAGDEPATAGVGEVLSDEEIVTAVAQLSEGTATREGVTVSDRPLEEIVSSPVLDIAERLAELTVKEMFEGADDAKETPVSEDEQAALAEPEVDPANSDPLYVAPTPEPEVESFASTTTEPDLKLDLVEAAPAEADYTTWSTAALRNTLAPAVGKDQSEAWSRDEMLMYLIKGLYPQKTVRGNWVYDSRRAGRVKSWSASEISDFIDGKLKLDQHVDVSTVWEEAFARYKIPPNWTIEAFVQYVCNGSTPEYSASGLLLNDRYRDAKRVHHLTYREIRGALLGEIETKFTREELMTQYRNRLGIGKSYSTERLLAEMPNQPNEVSMDNSVLRAKLDEYKTGITKNPGTQTEETAGACQSMLYKAIRDVIKRDFNEFVEGWNIILDFVNENYTTLFDPYKARRGWSQVALGKAQLTLFEDLLTVIVATREPGNRAKKQTYNLEIVLRHLPEENQRQNLFMYYQQ